jgi:hypothetical protein
MHTIGGHVGVAALDLPRYLLGMVRGSGRFQVSACQPPPPPDRATERTAERLRTGPRSPGVSALISTTWVVTLLALTGCSVLPPARWPRGNVHDLVATYELPRADDTAREERDTTTFALSLPPTGPGVEVLRLELRPSAATTSARERFTPGGQSRRFVWNIDALRDALGDDELRAHLRVRLEPDVDPLQWAARQLVGARRIDLERSAVWKPDAGLQ